MCKTIKQKVKFQASPLTIYTLLANAKKLCAFTGKEASMDETIGGRFSSYEGSIAGINVDLLPGKRIVQAWREQKFPEGIFSMATFNLVPTQDGGTELTLTHRGVPKELIPRISAEWRELYWNKIKQFLNTSKRGMQQ
ncbi:MAG: SRPBCC domain-containing protein [Bdellovibrionia bacterium]